MSTTNETSSAGKVNTQVDALIRALLSDQPVAYHPLVARAVGSATAGILLSQFLYWTPRTNDPDGWFFKTQTDITAETALSRAETETARARLTRLGVVEERRRGVPGKMHFRVDFGELQALLVSHNATSQQTTMLKSRIVQSEVAANHNATSPQSISETTSETTSEISVTDYRSEFRRGSRRKFQEDRHEESTDARGPTAPQLLETPPAASPGLTRIGEVLKANGLAPARAPSNQRLAAASDDVTAPSRPRQSRVRSAQASAEPQYPNDITEDQPAGEQPQPRSQAGPPPFYIDNVIDDVATKLIKDLSEAASYRTQARNIWEASGLDVQAFVDILYEARDRVRPRRGVDNKMGYFFKTVRVLVGLDENPNPPEGSPPPKGAVGSATPIGGGELRKSLAGKYAHLVRR